MEGTRLPDNIKPGVLRGFLRDYQKYVLSVLKPTASEIRALFTTWSKDDFWVGERHLTAAPIPSPIQSTTVRIKRPESVVDKIHRKLQSLPDGFSIESVRRRMHDAIGGRIVVYFLSNLPMIDKTIQGSKMLEISKDDPPVLYHGLDALGGRFGLGHIDHEEKESGYTSIHYTVRLKQSDVPKGDRPWFEIQVRTLVEHVWGEIEHVLGYKPDKKTGFAVTKQFRIIGRQLIAIDEHFNFFYEELSRYQTEGKFGDDNLLNAENLPRVLYAVGVGCAQKEIDGLLKLLKSRGFDTIGNFTAVANEENIAFIRETYTQQEKRLPVNFEVVASLAAIRGLKDRPAMTEAIQTQIAFLNVWSEIKSEIVADRRSLATRLAPTRRRRRAG